MSAVTERRILVVDDEPELRNLISMGLECLNATIKTAANGREALDLLKKEKFDAVLSDIKMPYMDGIQLLTELRKLDVEIPFVILTGHGDKQSAVDALRMGALDFIDKPFEEDALVDVMGKAVELGYQSRLLEDEIQQMLKQAKLPKERIDYYRNAKKAVIQLRIQNDAKQKKGKAS